MIVTFTHKEGEKLQVVKIIRDTLKCGLKEAKEFADQGFVPDLTVVDAEKLVYTLGQSGRVKSVESNNDPKDVENLLPIIDRVSEIKKDESITISFTPKEEYSNWNVSRAIHSKLAYSIKEITKIVKEGRLTCSMEDWLKIRDELQKVADVCVINDNTKDLLPVIDTEEVPQSKIMVASEVDEMTGDSITVVVSLIPVKQELVEKVQSDNRRMRSILPLIGSIIPQMRRATMGTIIDDNQCTQMVALYSPSCAIDLDKATQLGEFAEAIGEAIIDFIDNDFDEARIRAIAKDLAPLYEN